MARRDELGTACVWFGLGAAIAVASWRMDRLRHLDVNPWSVPGLTPGVIGVLMMAFALVLAVRSLRAPSQPTDATAATDATDATDAMNPIAPMDPIDPLDPAPAAGSSRDTLVAAALCVLFAGVTLGRGVPFVVQAALFVFAFTAVFSWQAWRRAGRVGRGLAQTLLIAVAAAVLIAGLFENVFLVRLP